MSLNRQELEPLLAAIDQDGFALVRSAFSDAEMAELAAHIESRLSADPDDAESLRDRTGTIYAGRNLLKVCPMVRDVWRRDVLVSLLEVVLGPSFGLVRALFFDKPPGRTWSLAWHRDLTIAVRAHVPASTAFAKPTVKAGVPHVEATREILANMLTLRIHLDAMDDENGPLRVIPGSHHTVTNDVTDESAIQTIHAAAGDVLAIRPRVIHSSISSLPTTVRHRRILHLEFAGSATLPDGYQWHDFVARYVTASK